MKNLLSILVFVGVTGAITALVVSKREATRYENLLRISSAEWEAERSKLETELREAQKPARVVTVVQPQNEKEIKSGPREILDSLKKLRASSNDPKTARRILHHLETLIDLGNSALPVIREFLARNEEVLYESSLPSSSKSAKDGKIQIDFVFPPSLRFGLLDAVRQIGGDDAEKLLAEVLSTTGRGVEVGYLTRVLQEMTPNKYRDLALSIARDLLAHPAATGQPGGLDKYDRNFLFGVLLFYNDASFAQQAQAGLIAADGGVDTGALKYLQTALGEQALPAVADAYKDPRILDAAKKEPLARLALNFAGANAQADELYRAAINDAGLSVDQRRELIEDLNQDGFENLRKPTPRDLELVKNRLELINRYRNDVDHKVVVGAFKEAEKDLLNMLAKHANASPKP